VLTIDRMAAGGDGVGRLDGLAVFVPRTAPGDVVQVAMTRHARLGRGRVLQLLTPSPHRVEPPCPHYVADRCGGCQVQHLDESTQQLMRRELVQETLRRLGRRDHPLPALTSGMAWRYRRRLTVTLVRAGGRWIGGLHPHDDPVRVFPLDACLLVEPVIEAAWHGIRTLLRRRDLAWPDVPRLRLALRGSTGEGDVDRVTLVVHGGRAWPEAEAWGHAAEAAVSGLAAVWWHPEGAAGSHRVWSPPGATVLDDPASGPMDDEPDGSAPGEVGAPSAADAVAFSQVNAHVAAALRAAVVEGVQAVAPSHVVDAYAGSGVVAAAFVAAGLQVTAIEMDPAGVAALRARLAAAAVAAGTAAGTAAATVVAGRVEEALPALASPAEVVVLNPPRRGVDPRVCAWLESSAAHAVRRVVYVSCNPATLARDLTRLPGWRLASISCFDMFPQTAHVETVCILDREAP
jgi:23S rRNA (uracil1939-C5)-methyltransferase